MHSLSSDPIALPEPLPVAEATAAIEAMVDGAAMDDATEGMSEEGQALLESVMDAAGVDPEGTDAEIAAAAQEAEATVEDAASDAATEAVDAVEDASEETDN